MGTGKEVAEPGLVVLFRVAITQINTRISPKRISAATLFLLRWVVAACGVGIGAVATRVRLQYRQTVAPSRMGSAQ
jgi:hypothetical protein